MHNLQLAPSVYVCLTADQLHEHSFVTVLSQFQFPVERSRNGQKKHVPIIYVQLTIDIRRRQRLPASTVRFSDARSDEKPNTVVIDV